MREFPFFIISIIEYIGIFAAMLSVFRFELRYYWTQILFSTFVLSILSHAMFLEYELGAAPLIQMVFQLMFMWLLFRIPLLYALLMQVTFSILYIALQSGLMNVVALLDDQETVFSATGTEMYLVQLMCAVIAGIIAWISQRKRIGFTFIPVHSMDKFSWTKLNMWLIVCSVFSFFLMFIIYFIFLDTQLDWLWLIFLVCVGLTVVFFYLMRRRDEEEYD